MLIQFYKSSYGTIIATHHFYDDYTDLFALAFLKISVSSFIWIKVVQSNSKEHIEMLAEHSPESVVIST